MREVFEDLETDAADDFDNFGSRIEDVANLMDDLLLEFENERVLAEEDEEEEQKDMGYEIE